MATAVATQDTSKIALINQRLRRLEPHLEAVLPKYCTPERMTRLALLAINRQPDLLACTAESIAEAVMQIAGWGLEIGRTAHIVAFKDRAQAIADYKGKIELAIASGVLLKCDARVVSEKDHFEVEYGLQERLVHRPAWQDDPGGIIGAYAIAALAGGVQRFELMSRQQIDGIKKRSRAGSNGKGPWATDFGEMAKKTVVHRLLKMVPQSPLLADAMAADEIEDEPAPTRSALRGGHVALPADAYSDASKRAADEMRGSHVQAEVIDMGQKPGVEPLDEAGDAYEADDEPQDGGRAHA